MIERLGDAVCGLHHVEGDEERGLIGLASKPRSTVSPGLASKSVATILLVWPQNHSFGFPDLGIKTGSCGLVIWLTKSSRWFLGLGLKTMWAMVYQLHHKSDEMMKTARGTHQDLVACFTWKRVGLGFPSRASRLEEAWCRWCTWHRYGGCVEMKPKTDESMQLAASDSSTPTLPFLLY
jgi:hypothetical protein